MNKNTIPAAPLTPRMLSISDVLDILPISRGTLWKYMTTPEEAHRLPAYKVKGRILVKPEEFNYWLDNHRFDPRRK